MNPPLIFAVVVMLAADTRADTTLPLRLNPVAFKLPPLILPVALTKPAVLTLPPTTLAVALTVAPCTKLVTTTLPATTLLVVTTLPDNTLPCALTLPSTANTLESLLYTRPPTASALPFVLNNTCVFAPGTTMLPVTLPAKLPTK